MSSISKLGVALFFLLSLSCSQQKEQLVLYYSINEPTGAIALKIREILEEELSVEVKTIIGEGSIADLVNVRNNVAQLALVENHVGFQERIKSLLPIYPQILHVFYKDDTDEPSDLKTILEGKNVFIGHEGDGSHLFATQLFSYFAVDPSSFSITENPFHADVLIGFTDIIKDEDLAGLNNFKLYSLDDVTKFGFGSKAEGLALKFPKVRPFTIPEDTYIRLSREPVLTLASDVVLVTNNDLSEDMAYRITKAIFRNLQEFNNISPLISQDLNEEFDRAALSFPLHDGARVYLDRDEPSILERYAELIGVGFSVLLALGSALYSISKWTLQRKKDRVDVFYQELMKIKKISAKLTSRKHVLYLIRQIKLEQEKAFQMLIDEKLQANESFRIYMELSKETQQELQVKLTKMPSDSNSNFATQQKIHQNGQAQIVI